MDNIDIVSMTLATESELASAGDLARAASRLYPEKTLLSTLQRWRPWICPLDRVLPQVPHNSRVLDVGCGGGLLLGLLARRGATGLGVDMSASAIAVANAMKVRTGANGLTFECRDATAPWPQGEFDVVCLIDVLHHVPVAEQRAVFGKAVAALRPGGRIVYKDMVFRPRWRAAANQMHDLVMARQWIHHVPVAAVETWAAELGLSTVHSELTNRLWYGHDLRVFQ